MESKVDEILKQLHKYLFADSQQIIIELKHYLHDYTHNEGDLAFISSKIFNSSESLLEFLRKNVSENDKLIVGIKKRIYELIIEYSHHRPLQLSAYLPQIKETCMRSFLGDANSFVKEAALKLLLRIIDHYHITEVSKIVAPRELIQVLLDQIKLKRPAAMVKGAIWNLVGILHKKFGAGVNEWLTESQDQMYRELKDQFQSKAPEFRAIVGIIQGLSLSLEHDCTLTDDELEGLFIRVKTAMQPIPDIAKKTVQKQSMKLFRTHVELFKKIIPRHSEQMVKLTLQLCVDTDINVRDAANDMLGGLMQLISDGLINDDSIHKDIFTKIIRQFQVILEDPNNNVQLISAIKAIGVFSKAIKTFMSEEMLLKYLERLIELSEYKLIKEFEEQKNPEDDVQNFKYILKKQKQLICYIESYSYILVQLEQSPSEQNLNHFFRVCTIGVCNHRKLFEKYKARFYEALASLVMSLSHHQESFSQWIRKFVRKTLQETLKIPDAAIFGGESPEESLKDAIQFWREWLNKDELWSEYTCRRVYDELIHTIIEDITEVNLTYRVSEHSQRQNLGPEAAPQLGEADQKGIEAIEKAVDEDILGHFDASGGMIAYHANNNNHQQYLKRIADFLDILVPSCHDHWFLKWVPHISDILIKKSIETPRVPRIYQILATTMQICNKYKYFDKIQDQKSQSQRSQQQQQIEVGHMQVADHDNEPMQNESEIDLGEKINVFNRLLSYFKDLIGKAEEYQDELLLSCIDLLLNVPLALLYSKEIGTDNVELWKGVMLKALGLGHIDNGIAMTCINMLEEWFNTLPPNTTVKLYQEILPKLSEYLNVESDTNQANSTKSQFYHQVVLEKETELGRRKITRKVISNKVLDLLGKIGGYAHNIINNELSKKHDKKNFIRWDPEKRLKFTLPLYNRKIDVYLDSCLPRIVDLAQNSNKKEIRMAACEFLHSLIIFMIGKNAQKPQQRQVRNRRGANQGQERNSQEEMAAFAKLYAKLFPVIIKLATEIELISRQLFEPLCYQIVRWFSSSKIYEHPEVESLLDSLIEGAQNKNNTSLRQLCSNAVAEFAKWSLKQMTDNEIQENPANIKSLIRRIESNSNHPDPFKRLSSILCFNKIFSVIREFDPLVDRFCLEICYSVLESLKMCYDKMELSHEVIETSTRLLPKIEKVILKKWGMLMAKNDNRGIVPDLITMMLFVFEKFKCRETVYRRESIKLWENLVTKSPPSSNPRLNIPNNVKRWIKDYYCVHRREKSILMQMQMIDFSPSHASNEDVNHDPQQRQEDVLRKNKLIAQKKQFDQLTAQLEFMDWLLTKGKFNLAELAQLQFRSSTIAKNVNSFLKDIINKSFDKNKSSICQQVLICKEDRELLTKSQIVVLIQIFSLLNLALEKNLNQGMDQEFQAWINGCLKDFDEGFCSTQHQDQSQSHNQQYFVELAIFVVLTPQIFKLQLLVEDKELESKLHSHALKYLQNYNLIYGEKKGQNRGVQDDKGYDRESSSPGILTNLISNRLSEDIKILDLKFIQPEKANIYAPRLLLNLCRGYLKLAEIDESLRDYLIDEIKEITSNRRPPQDQISSQKAAKKNLKDIIESWLESDSPFENESARVLVDFMRNLKISNRVLLEWITQKTAIYHKCNDILLNYITEKWSEPQPQEPPEDQPEEQSEQSQPAEGRPEKSSLEPVEPDGDDQPMDGEDGQLFLGVPRTRSRRRGASPSGVDYGSQIVSKSQTNHQGSLSQGKQSQNSNKKKKQEHQAPEPHYSCLGEFLIAKIPNHQAMLYSMFIPIIEKLSENSANQAEGNKYKKILIEYIPEYCKREINHEFKDVAINQIKIFGLIAVKSRDLLMDATNAGSQKFLQYLIERISAFLKERFSVYVKKEVFNLISLVADFPAPSACLQPNEQPKSANPHQRQPSYNRFANQKVETVFDRVVPSLNYVKKLHFPMKSRELRRNTNEAQNFHVIIEAFLNMAIITKNLKVLRELYQVIREHKTTFEQTLKNSINIIVTQQINALPKGEFIACVSEFINEFLNRSMDFSIDDNIRWAIAKKIIIRILETCSKEQLADLMIHWHHKFSVEVLGDTKFDDFLDKEPIYFFNLVREKTFIMVFYEIMYRRLPVQMIKEEVHKRIYGEDCAQNELTRFLIEEAAVGKREPIKGFANICQDVKKDAEGNVLSGNIDAELKEVNSQRAVQMMHCCASYSLLSSAIVCSQTHEVAFANFLFNARQLNATHSMWSFIIDTQNEFEFKVQTNFNHIELKNIEQKLAESEAQGKGLKDIASIRVQNMMNEYLTQSFMGTNEKFNQNMVFETQLDQMSMKKEEEKYQEIFNKRLNPHDRRNNLNRGQEAHDSSRNQGKQAIASPLPSLPSQESQDKLLHGEDEMMQNEDSQNQPGNFIPDEESQFELDQVNKHWCMKNIKRCIERMKALFGEEWKNNEKQMPKFAHYLLEEFCRQDTHINIKIFILKIVTNNPKLFKPHANLWFRPICEYIISKKNGGKGFHYFLRDICTMLISWNYVPENSSRTKILLTEVINSLMLISADPTKLIFKQNIKIISTLMEKWRKLIAINKLFVTTMISRPDSEAASPLWKMNAIEILALAVCYDIPILVKPEEVEYLSPAEQKFRLLQRNDQNQANRRAGSDSNKRDPLLVAILKIYESKKKQIIYATSELIGMILNHQKEEPYFQEQLLKNTKVAIFSNEVKERHDVFVYSIERASREYSELLVDRQIFMKTISFINILTGSMRAAVFKTYERYIKIAKQRNNLADIEEISMSLLAVLKEILADINDENQQAFISLLITLAQLKGVDSVEKLIEQVVPQLKHLFVNNKNEYSRGLFYDLMVNLYDRYEEYRQNEMVKGSLIHGLNDSSKMIRDKLAEFWNDQNRLDLDPLVRLQQLMETMYVNDEESIWLTNAAYLILSVSSRSSDFDRKIFEDPLQECQFTPLYLNMSDSIGISNRSQPMTPLFTQIDQMIQASQNNQDMIARQNQSKNQDQNTFENNIQQTNGALSSPGSQGRTEQINSSSVNDPNQNRNNAQTRQNNYREEERQQMEQGFVRATQLPQFTQTQGPQSALIAGLRSGGAQASLSDSVQRIGSNGTGERSRGNAKAPGNPGNRPVHYGGIKGGTQLFTIHEEGGEDGHQNENPPNDQFSQDSEGFIAPAPMKPRTNSSFSKFFKKSDFLYRPMEVTEGQKIRFVHEATMPSHLARQEEIRRMQRQQFIDRQIKQRKNQVSLYRKYRIGELPDIQIDFKDVLMPLMAIVRTDSTVATEIFVEIFQEAYKEQRDEEARLKLGLGLKSILSSSKIFDYSTMNCCHRIAMELLKIDGFTIDSQIIERTGEHSMSFQTSLILLEESLMRGDMTQVMEQQDSNSQGRSGRRRLNNEKGGGMAPSIDNMRRNRSNMHSITNLNRQYWFKLIKLYEIIGNQDALHGIWCQLASQDGVMFRQQKDQSEDQNCQENQQSLSQSQNIDPNRIQQMAQNYDQEEVVNLIKHAQDLKNKGKIEVALREMERTLNNPDLCRDFEESVMRELENKKFEYKSELLKWDQIASELLSKNENKQLHEIADTSGFKQVDLLIRSQIRSEHHWGSLTSQINNWMRDDYSKAMLEKNFSYELALLFLTQLDYDRARICIERESTELLSQWKNLTKLSQVAQHFLVQRIQKIYEMKEFLNLIKIDNNQNYQLEDQITQIAKSIKNWKQRSPSESFDPLCVWDDISSARQFFIDHYCMKFENTPLHSALLGNRIQLNQQNQDLREVLQQISDIQVMLHIQTAKGAFKMGAYDSSDRYLKMFQNKRNPNSTNDMRIVVPIIKLKTEQSKSEMRNMNFDQKIEKIQKIYKVLTKKMQDNQHDLSQMMNFHNNNNQADAINSSSLVEDHLGPNPSFESIKTVIKSNLLKYGLQKKLLSVTLAESQAERSVSGLQRYSRDTNLYLSESFESLENLQTYLMQDCILGEHSQQEDPKAANGNSQNRMNAQLAGNTLMSQQQKSYRVHQQGKVLFKLAKFSDKLLRKMEQKDTGPQVLLTQGLQEIGKSEENLAKMTIQSGIQALNMGYLKASDIIPRILDVIGKYGRKVKDEFVENSKSTPAWLFLRWISQIAAVLNRPESSIIQNMVAKIAQKYPQALFYPFKVIESNLEINLMDQVNRKAQESGLFSSLKREFKSFGMLNQWVEALDCLIFPEHRFRYWFQIVCDTTQDPAMKQHLLEATGQSASPRVNAHQNVLLQKIRQIVLLMYQDIMTRSKPMVGEDIGIYNRQFIEKWEGLFRKRFGANGQRVSSMDLTSLVTELRHINEKISSDQLFQGNEMISKYSEWLDQLDCSEFYQIKNYIEIPGQYENILFNQEPISTQNVKIASVKKVCLVLGSIRRPKKITIHGSNEKDYHLLIKGGEDLRLDQRVQQLFGIMNRIFAEDPSCENRDLNLKTFKVVPITNRLGSLEWVDNTEPMKALISKEHKRLENGNDIHQSRAYKQRINWLGKIPGNRGASNPNPAQLHLALLKHEENAVIKAFEEHQSAFPYYLLRNALENLCLNSSAFLTIKNQFIKSMAVFSIASYLIGIGDRHLENFLIDTTDGEVLGIDFGIAFGSNVHLSIPELMPFRLTQQIEGVIAPHPLEGIYKQTMVHTLSAMRKKKSLILDTCEIFVKEPLLDWVKDAKQRNRGQRQAGQSGSVSNSGAQGGQNSGQNELDQLNALGSILTSTAGDGGNQLGDELSLLSWYPRQKIDIVKQKLLGVNPVKILARELRESVHERKDYYHGIKKAIQGPEDGIRYYHLSQRPPRKYLDAGDQVDVLIELARDPNILGRTWIGWSPYI